MGFLKPAIKSLGEIFGSKAKKSFMNCERLSFSANIEGNNFIAKKAKIVLALGLMSKFIRRGGAYSASRVSGAREVMLACRGLETKRNVVLCSLRKEDDKYLDFLGRVRKIFMYAILAI
jgi:hypothetical protein